MDNLRSVLTTLDDIKKLATQVAKKSQPIIKKIEESYANEVLEVNPNFGLAREQIVEKMLAIVATWTERADKVNVEIDKFVVEDNNTFSISPSPEVTPFLSEVWYGDTYDKEGLQGLLALKKALTDDVALVSEKSLITTFKKNVRPVTATT